VSDSVFEWEVVSRASDSRGNLKLAGCGLGVSLGVAGGRGLLDGVASADTRLVDLGGATRSLWEGEPPLLGLSRKGEWRCMARVPVEARKNQYVQSTR
jgi:hypothetical protein